ncbi:FkbM family methyltransferase [Altererythrobacter ishigakiensis]|uniref:FkbM family methyltransferase n=1 Tax=Altererythrobacter ishigakiensis TaxID=476157 RepID=A0A562USP6_9SPHN|nr:FkbM family methyltransferase [Altererythrobacter ishigakiensis]
MTRRSLHLLSRLLYTLAPITWAKISDALRSPNQERERLFLNAIIKPGDVAIDVGAHNGLYTRALERAGAQVLAFEPFPEVGLVIERTTGRSVEWRQKAISNRGGEAEIRVPISNNRPVYGYASMAPENFFGPDFVVHNVPVSTIDNEIRERCSFIKIDVEGHELDVLRGTLGTIDAYAPAFLIESEARHAKRAPLSVFEFFAEIGYEGFFILGNNLKSVSEFKIEDHQNPDAIDLEGSEKDRNYINNFFFFPSRSKLPGQLAAELARRAK